MHKLTTNRQKFLLGWLLLSLASLSVIMVVWWRLDRAEQKTLAEQDRNFQQQNFALKLRFDNTDFPAEVLDQVTSNPLNFVFPSDKEGIRPVLQLTIANQTDQDYISEILATVEADPIVVTDQVATSDPIRYDLQPYQTHQIDIELPLNYSEKSGIIQISLQAAGKKLQYHWHFNSKLLQDNELVQLQAHAKTTKLVFTTAQKPTLSYNLNFKNLVSQPWDDCYYELNLVNSQNKFVQPLVVEELKLAASENKGFAGEFQFTVPPADLTNLSTGNYKLQLIFHGNIDSRALQTQVISSETFNFDLQSY